MFFGFIGLDSVGLGRIPSDRPCIIRPVWGKAKIGFGGLRLIHDAEGRSSAPPLGITSFFVKQIAAGGPGI